MAQRCDAHGELAYVEIADEMQLRTSEVRRWHNYWAYAMRGPVE